MCNPVQNCGVLVQSSLGLGFGTERNCAVLIRSRVERGFSSKKWSFSEAGWKCGVLVEFGVLVQSVQF